MSATTGPILAMGTISVVNETIFNDQPMDWRIPVATGLLAIGFSLGERVWPKGAEILAWTGVVTILLGRTKSNVPSPVESALTWWNQKGS